ncbi:HEPN domain protein [Bacteroidales bacterium Barb6XT]|nr:HEPN domain protein [Bacteroidales bacterium Barb6XT]
MNDTVLYWVEISDYDFETALAMQKTGRYLYVGFMCHQTIEKILKGYYRSAIREIPPYTHSLSRLAQESGLIRELNEEQLRIIDSLNPLNIASRYPDYKKELTEVLNKNRCKELLKNTEDLQQWIKAKL